MSTVDPAPTARELGLMNGTPPVGDALVTLANWQDPPFNRWAFQHLRELVPNARIARAATVRELPRDPQELGGIEFTLGGETHTVEEMLNATYTDGFLVLHRGRIVTERYFNGLSPDRTHLIMSVTKSVVATVAGILAGRGELDPEGLITAVLPELEGTSWEGATVRHLLDMRAGTKFSEDYTDLDAEVRVFEQVYLWRPRTDDSLPEDACTYMAGLENDRPHGGPFDYRSILTSMLGWVVERAGGARLADLIAREVWQPIGAEFDAEITVDGHGTAMADGGMCATLRDLARFGALWLGQGKLDGGRIIPEEWVADTLAGGPDSHEAFLASGDWPELPNSFYRNKWWMLDSERPRFAALGINGQKIWIDPPTETVVVKLSTYPTALDDRLDALTFAAAAAIARTLSG
jgi:CubicO group peptidase (beta-lactamase class C family)